jgi:hypothetical protein
MKKELKPFDLNEIQICPICFKIDVYKDDGHDCSLELERRLAREMED